VDSGLLDFYAARLAALSVRNGSLQSSRGEGPGGGGVAPPLGPSRLATAVPVITAELAAGTRRSRSRSGDKGGARQAAQVLDLERHHHHRQRRDRYRPAPEQHLP
jgi:hypothetical protein